MWNSNENSGGTLMPSPTLQLKCNGNHYDVSGLNGFNLAERIKQVARENQIGKFDIYDSANNVVNPSDLEKGNFTGPLSIIRFNSAA